MSSCRIPIAVVTCTGFDGPPNTLTIGEVDTLPPGADATASITGAAPNQTLNLGIPGARDRPSRWWGETPSLPSHTDVPDPRPGDMFVYDTGDLWTYDGSNWVQVGNIRGPAGAGNVSSVNGNPGPAVVLTPADLGLQNAVLSVNGKPGPSVTITPTDLGLFDDRLYVSGREYGIVGNNTTDDSDALQTAIDDAASMRRKLVIDSVGRTLRIGKPIHLPSNAHIDFNGVTLSRAYNTNTLGTAILQMRNVENITLENGTLYGNGDQFPNGTSGYNLCAGFAVDRITWRNMKFRHVIDNHSIDLTDATNIRILDCDFLGFKHNGNRAFSESIQVDPNGINNNWAALNSKWLVQGCYFGPSDTNPGSWGPPGGGIGDHADRQSTQSGQMRITGNTFDGCSYVSVRLFKFADVTVDGNNFLDVNCAVRSNPATDGVTSANDSRGYRFAITNNTMTGPETADASDLIQLSWADNVTVSGNVIQGGAAGIHARFCRVLAITGNTVTYSWNQGIVVNETGYAGFELQGHTADVTISGNVVKYSGLAGIESAGTRRLSLTGNVVTAPRMRTEGPAYRLADANIAVITGNINTQSTSPRPATEGLERAGGQTNVLLGVNYFTPED